MKAPFSFIISEVKEKIKSYYLTVSKSRLFEFLQEEIQLAVDDEWDIEDLSATIDKYNI